MLTIDPWKTKNGGQLIQLVDLRAAIFAPSLPDHSRLEYTALTAVASWTWLVLGAAVATLWGWVPAPAGAAVAGLLPPLLYTAMVPNVLAVLAFNFGVRRLGPTIGMLLSAAQPAEAGAFGQSNGVRGHRAAPAGAAQCPH
jgi:drug/metabolite transporter (DMT)-like permease